LALALLASKGVGWPSGLGFGIEFWAGLNDYSRAESLGDFLSRNKSLKIAA
jgi:hypothetical protein